MAFFGYGIPLHSLDEEFDAPDIVADHELCRALAAGKAGLHPDAWGNHDLLSTLPPPCRRHQLEAVTRSGVPLPVDPAWEEQHRRRPLEPSPIKPARTAWRLWRAPPERVPAEDTIDGYGWLRLTCDECSAAFKTTLRYPAGLRPAMVVTIRAMGRDKGWTCIVGRDRCPRCSQPAAPEAVGNGAGKDEDHEQYADRGH